MWQGVVVSIHITAAAKGPMAMGDFEAVAKVNALDSLSEEERAQILGKNAWRALGL